MPIKRTGSRKAVESWVDRQLDWLHTRMVETAHYVGLGAVTVAREQHKYTTRTGNLQSSVGYVIVQDGQIIDRDFKQEAQGSEGLAKGQSFAESLASQYPKGLHVIVVAGMPYAVYVEAMGLDVLDSAEIHAKDDLKNKLEIVKKRWQQRMNSQ